MPQCVSIILSFPFFSLYQKPALVINMERKRERLKRKVDIVCFGLTELVVTKRSKWVNTKLSEQFKFYLLLPLVS